MKLYELEEGLKDWFKLGKSSDAAADTQRVINPETGTPSVFPPERSTLQKWRDLFTGKKDDTLSDLANQRRDPYVGDDEIADPRLFANDADFVNPSSASRRVSPTTTQQQKPALLQPKSDATAPGNKKSSSNKKSDGGKSSSNKKSDGGKSSSNKKSTKKGTDTDNTDTNNPVLPATPAAAAADNTASSTASAADNTVIPSTAAADNTVIPSTAAADNTASSTASAATDTPKPGILDKAGDVADAWRRMRYGTTDPETIARIRQMDRSPAAAPGAANTANTTADAGTTAAATDAPPPGTLSKVFKTAKDNKIATGALGYGAYDYLTGDDPWDVKGFLSRSKDRLGDLWSAKKDSTTPDANTQQNAPAAPAANNQQNAPAADGEYEVPDEPVDGDDKKEDFIREISEIMKLTGQRSITQRDNIAGIIKAKEIKTLTESTDLSECGGTIMNTNQPSSLNISASAGSGEEVASMLQSIMTLAGVRPVSSDMMPNERDPMVMKSDPVLTAQISSPDSCNHTPEGMECPLHGMSECSMEETYDNSPEVTEQPYDPDSMAHVINKVSAADMATTPYQSASNPLVKEQGLKEQSDVYKGLFKAYEAFKNQ
jgi:hypothetical protein